MFVRVSPEARGARRPAGARGRVVRGARWVVETDVADCFGAIPHSGLMSAVEERISDRRLLSLLRAFLRAGVMETGHGAASGHRHPAGRGDSSVAVQRLPAPARPGVAGRVRDLVRYADDALVMCRSKGQAEAALARLTVLLAELGLRTEGGQDPDRAPERGWAREWTSLASTIGWCDPGRAPGPRRRSPSWPAGPHARRCSTPETASGS